VIVPGGIRRLVAKGTRTQIRAGEQGCPRPAVELDDMCLQIPLARKCITALLTLVLYLLMAFGEMFRLISVEFATFFALFTFVMMHIPMRHHKQCKECNECYTDQSDVLQPQQILCPNVDQKLQISCSSRRLAKTWAVPSWPEYNTKNSTARGGRTMIVGEKKERKECERWEEDLICILNSRDRNNISF
jgi:hypothetical protein